MAINFIIHSNRKSQKAKNGGWFLSIFAAVFLGVGLWMLISISTELINWLNMKSWVATKAYVSSGGCNSNSSDNSTTYEAYASYNYTYNGRSYTNDRVSIYEGSDNIGDFQKDLGNMLSNAASSGRAITIFVNPSNPADAIVNRDIRWEMIGFRLIFVITFGGVGLGILIWQIKTRNQKPIDPEDPLYKEKPWLANKNWQNNVIYSSSKMMVYFTWIFAIFWNAISSPLLFIVKREIERQNFAALFGILFPFVGVILLIWAVRTTIAWKKFGRSPLTLDPFPGSIGGHVGGHIDLNIPYSESNEFMITISNLYSYISGSGKNRSRREKLLWQDKLVGHTEAGYKGTRVTFRFDVPDDNPKIKPSDASKTETSYNLWRINLTAKLDGIDIDRDFEIPVYPTKEKSRSISDKVIEHSEKNTEKIEEIAARKIIQFGKTSYGNKIHFPFGRNLSSAFVAILAGCVFAGAGLFIILHEHKHIFGSIFFIVGSLILPGGIYMFTNSLTVMKNYMGGITTIRRILGIPVIRKEFKAEDIVKFSKSTNFSSGEGHKQVQYFKIFAHDKLGNKFIVGEGFKGEGEADAAIKIIAETFGIEIK